MTDQKNLRMIGQPEVSGFAENWKPNKTNRRWVYWNFIPASFLLSSQLKFSKQKNPNPNFKIIFKSNFLDKESLFFCSCCSCIARVSSEELNVTVSLFVLFVRCFFHWAPLSPWSISYLKHSDCFKLLTSFVCELFNLWRCHLRNSSITLSSILFIKQQFLDRVLITIVFLFLNLHFWFPNCFEFYNFNSIWRVWIFFLTKFGTLKNL